MTMPVVASTVATPVFELVQVPPGVPSLRVIELCAQSLVMPVAGSTGGLTVMVVVRMQLVPVL